MTHFALGADVSSKQYHPASHGVHSVTAPKPTVGLYVPTGQFSSSGVARGKENETGMYKHNSHLVHKD